LTLAWISLAALVVAIVVSCATKLNVGVLSLAFAWLIGVYLAPIWGEPLTVREVLAGFPADLFLTLAGITMLFTQAHANGTLERVAQHAVRLSRGNVGFVPVTFFVLTFLIASVGAGNIASAALVAPMAMAVATRAGIPAFLMTIMVAHGAVAGGMSPFAPTGVTAARILADMGLGGIEWRTYLNTLFVSAPVGIAGYLGLGGWRLFRRTDASAAAGAAPAFERHHITTLVIVIALVTAVVIVGADVGMAAFAAALLMMLVGKVDEAAVLRAMPWGVIIMVCGVTVLARLLERTGGMDLFTSLLASLGGRGTITGVIALITGLVSAYSSTTGVVLPAFLPTVPGLIAKLGGGDPVAIASSIVVGGNLVDVSPLSTIGALCVAAAPPAVDRRALFNQSLGWGLSMAVVGAAVCQIFFGWLA
jgi:di/tricarboxylate transporter